MPVTFSSLKDAHLTMTTTYARLVVVTVPLLDHRWQSWVASRDWGVAVHVVGFLNRVGEDFVARG
ncbi:hypothetical protein GCM10025862_22390 [Arsenicicoccus piscis]|uniref:Uncharacterized protein n=2 Tax=Arsenicicoccus piscis TaxID=673954 RepID=A0ABQ6HP30_9MICO|nr:hypothetical protein GCM10025862_22390 [Arsenicicoccus piscis]